MAVGRRYEGSLSGDGLRFAIVTAKFNGDITGRMLEGARAALREHGVAGDCVDEAAAPGAFELPLVARILAETGRYHAIICIGAVIKGDTSHDVYIAGQAAAGIQRAALDTGVPVIFGVITPDTMEQAIERAGGKVNKGYEAALTAIEMANLLRDAGVA